MSIYKITQNSFRIVGQRFIVDLQFFCDNRFSAKLI